MDGGIAEQLAIDATAISSIEFREKPIRPGLQPFDKAARTEISAEAYGSCLATLQ